MTRDNTARLQPLTQGPDPLGNSGRTRSKASLAQSWKGMAAKPRAKRPWPMLTVGQRIVTETAFRGYEAKARRGLQRGAELRDVVRTMAHQLATGGHCPAMQEDAPLHGLPDVVRWFGEYDHLLQVGSVNRLQARDRLRALVRDLLLESILPTAPAPEAL